MAKSFNGDGALGVTVGPTADAGLEELLAAAHDGGEYSGIIHGKAFQALLDFVRADMMFHFKGWPIGKVWPHAVKGYLAHVNDRAWRQRVDILFTDDVGTPGCPPDFTVGVRYRLGTEALFEVELVGRNLSLGLRRER